MTRTHRRRSGPSPHLLALGLCIVLALLGVCIWLAVGVLV